MSAASQPVHVRPPRRDLPLRVGTRGSPLALVQTRLFLALLRGFCPVLRDMNVFEEQPIRTTGDAVQDRRLAEIGGKGLFAKEIHEALVERRIDFAVHSLKDLETALPDGVVLACLLRREDARDVLIVGSGAASSNQSALPAPGARHEIAESAPHSGESGTPAAAVDPRFETIAGMTETIAGMTKAMQLFPHAFRAKRDPGGRCQWARGWEPPRRGGRRSCCTCGRTCGS